MRTWYTCGRENARRDISVAWIDLENEAGKFADWPKSAAAVPSMQGRGRAGRQMRRWRHQLHRHAPCRNKKNRLARLTWEQEGMMHGSQASGGHRMHSTTTQIQPRFVR